MVDESFRAAVHGACVEHDRCAFFPRRHGESRRNLGLVAVEQDDARTDGGEIDAPLRQGLGIFPVVDQEALPVGLDEHHGKRRGRGATHHQIRYDAIPA